MSSVPTPITPVASQSIPHAVAPAPAAGHPAAHAGTNPAPHADPCAVAVAVASLVAIDPTVRVMSGVIHASVDGEAYASTNPALCVWSTDNRFPPQFFHESTFEGSLEAAWQFLQAAYTRTATSQRAADEAEGGIIIPDYLY